MIQRLCRIGAAGLFSLQERFQGQVTMLVQDLTYRNPLLCLQTYSIQSTASPETSFKSLLC